MNWYLITTAAWLGVLTAISPCPMATNISAISFIGRFVGSNRRVLLSGLLYTCGRTFVYIIAGILISAGILSSSEISLFLQKYLNEIIGPVLILLGMVLLGIIGVSYSFNIIDGKKIQEHTKKRGVLFSFPLGVIFALSFCPVSAGLFFGGLIPIVIKYNSSFFLPAIYGIGTALPVIFFAFIIAFASKYLGRIFDCLTKIEICFRYITGILFILVGIYYSIIYIYEVIIF